MPRQGEGHIADNAIDSKNPITHGTGKAQEVSPLQLKFIMPIVEALPTPRFVSSGCIHPPLSHYVPPRSMEPRAAFAEYLERVQNAPLPFLSPSFLGVLVVNYPTLYDAAATLLTGKSQAEHVERADKTAEMPEVEKVCSPFTQVLVDEVVLMIS